MPEDPADQVENAFTMQQNKLYTEGLHSELEKERIGHLAYLNSLCQNYIRTNANLPSSMNGCRTGRSTNW